MLDALSSSFGGEMKNAVLSSSFSIFKLSYVSFFLNKPASELIANDLEFEAIFVLFSSTFLEWFNLFAIILFFINFSESLNNLSLNLISFVCSGRLIFVSSPMLLLFGLISSMLISSKTESNSVLFDLFSLIFAGKFADASVIISFCATSIAEEMPTIE